MHRGWRDNPVFKSAPYTEQDAWVWLIESANFKESTFYHKNQPYQIKRGQVATSHRKLQSTWRWSQGRVSGYLRKLKNAGMIDTVPDTPFTLIQLTNYDLYQFQPDTQIGTQADTKSSTQADTNQIKQSPVKKKNQEITSMFNDFWTEYPKKKAKQRAEKVFRSLLTKEKVPFEAIMEGLRRYIQEIALLETEEQYIKHPAGWLNNRCWEDQYQTIRRMNHDNQKDGRNHARFTRKSVTEEARNVLAAIDRGEL